MTLLAPWFLLGLLAVAVPLILHLRRSRRAQKIVFSTNQFFDEQFIRSARRARIQDLLLLVLRMALLAFFVLALAQPLIRTPGLAGLLGMGGGGRQVAIVLDDSASMTASGARGVLLERAKAGALAVIGELDPRRGDKATVVLAGLREVGPKVLFEKPTTDLEAVRLAIREAAPTDLATDVDAAVRAASVTLGVADAEAGASAGAEIYVFSDLQESAVPVGGMEGLDSRAGVLMVATRPDDGQPANLSVDAVQYGAARPMLHVPFTFRVLLTNHGPRSRTATATLVVDDEPVNQQEVELEAGRSRIIRFVHRFTKAGWHGGRIVLSGGDGAEAESLAADDRRYFAVHVEDRLRLLAINGAPSHVAAQDELFFLRLALTVRPEAGAGKAGVAVVDAPILVDQITPVEVALPRLRDYRLVVMANVANLSPAALEALEKYVDQGGSLLITLGDRVDPKVYDAWVGKHRLHGGLLPGRLTRLVEAEAESALPAGPDQDAGFVASVDETHPALAGFGTGGLGSLTSVRFTRRFDIEPLDADVLMRGPAGEPLLLERRAGQGRVLMFVSTIDRDWTNFPLQPTFVPWLYRVVSYMAQQQVQRGNFVRTGQVVALPASSTQVQTLQVDKPDGRVGYGGPDPRDEAASAVAVFTETEGAGVYRLRPTTGGDAAAPTAMFAANLPAEESVQRYLGRDDLTGIAGDAQVVYIDDPESVTEAGQVARLGLGLWNVLLGLALVVAVAEPWVANWLSKRRAARATDALGKRDVLPGAGRSAA
ncbi:MAG TPA: BatA domain-containing protein [Phycisphaerae bacterium]|nr:BatA domain-containing protein [Phycisphaerae bacterium]